MSAPSITRPRNLRARSDRHVAELAALEIRERAEPMTLEAIERSRWAAVDKPIPEAPSDELLKAARSKPPPGALMRPRVISRMTGSFLTRIPRIFTIGRGPCCRAGCDCAGTRASARAADGGRNRARSVERGCPRSATGNERRSRRPGGQYGFRAAPKRMA